VALRPLVEMERVSSRIAAGALSLRLAEPPAQDEETVRRLMSGMYAEVERMQRLVADLLALTRLDEGRIKLHVEAVDVSQLVNEVREQIQGLVHGQELCYQVLPDLPALRGDIDQLRRVLLNVVENAVKFTPPAGRVELAAHGECTEFVTFEVRDTGVGIPLEALPHVFERFYRADPSRIRLALQAGGSGLGLSIAKELVEAHGGTIAMSSIVAEGTAVTIRLPAMPYVPFAGVTLLHALRVAPVLLECLLEGVEHALVRDDDA